VFIELIRPRSDIGKAMVGDFVLNSPAMRDGASMHGGRHDIYDMFNSFTSLNVECGAK
jgi:hypothetical protein